MSTISIGSSNTVANLNGLAGLGPTEAILTADSLTGVTVDVDLGIASAFTIVGSPESSVDVNPDDESVLPISILSTLFIETNGADVTLSEGALASVGALSGTTIDINNGGTFQMGTGLITASLLNSTTFGFGPGGGTDLITTDTSFLPISLLDSEGAITGFTASNDIITDQALNYADITGYSISTETGGAQTITVLTSDDSNLTFAVAGDSLTSGTFAAHAGPLDLTDSNGGLAVALCYLRGTAILTPTGEKPIETLKIGDRVVTRFGGIRTIEWIGRQSYAPRFLRNNPAKVPVRLQPGALGPNLPARELCVSPGHSLLLGDVLVLASTLINGLTITQSFAEDSTVEYYQLDLGAHDCVIADGTWAETFSDAPGMRAQFHNAAEYDALYPDRPPVQSQSLCAPRPEFGEALEQALRPVADIAAARSTAGRLEGYIDRAEGWKIIGWAMDESRPALPMLLEIMAGEEVLGTALACEPRADLAAAGKGTGRCGFSFSPPKRLSREALASLRVCRADDGVELGLTDLCHAELFGETPPQPEIRIAS